MIELFLQFVFEINKIIHFCTMYLSPSLVIRKVAKLSIYKMVNTGEFSE